MPWVIMTYQKRKEYQPNRERVSCTLYPRITVQGAAAADCFCPVVPDCQCKECREKYRPDGDPLHLAELEEILVSMDRPNPGK